ncbi:hypothetical protein QLG07_17810 [Erwinia sp. V90_4]|jgi:hypothetical protein|uniref:Uncharacterized protein n=1 Tax=Erwinia aphidicola TaxID=68334 RepID=A0ABU8DBZ3_ERWAP|nr:MULTISPECIES: hypothetical protein [Erwinia]MDI3441325.1 hypothetical protein [Erwinia sp. V90_4]
MTMKNSGLIAIFLKAADTIQAVALFWCLVLVRDVFCGAGQF